MRSSHLVAFVSALGVATTLARSAHAEDNVARSDALFAEGKALEASDLHAACAKYAAAYEANAHAIGVLLNVARCDEKLGRVASAVTKYRLARDMATEQDMKPQLTVANERIAELAPRVSYATIKLRGAVAPSASVVIDNKQVVALDALTDVPVDGGEHEVTFSAPGYLTVTVPFAVAEGEKRSVEIVVSRAVSAGTARRKLGIITGSVGAAAGVTGLVVALIARSNWKDAHSRCNDAGACPPDEYSDVNRARSLANVGTVLGISSAIVVGVGAYLYFTAPSGFEPAVTKERAVSIVPSASDQAVGVSAFGRF